ncbi:MULTISPECIES: phosphonate ABC transporter, permease protein PhnE [Chelatococcus]|uniref:Phosphonate transport system permease protein n=1 Tax=Chelatococcus caeni TaxID=1348468 RepID=A0A840BTU7_9HYPH|nr:MULTISPECIES: phosphonate ABC transporter, permease protein PhnE [Chelatococcus]ALA19028.1 phosphonate ABC transporter permease [Chelatococcus sp. CO-6]MBB4016284.1 phosphonate transport system permease protein [Chelatococcus caeni]
MSAPAAPGRLRPPAFPANWPARLAWAGLVIYTIYATSVLDVTLARFIAGLGNAGHFLSRMFPPNMAPDKLALIYTGMVESLQIAVLATFAGVLLSLPLGLAAARNLAPVAVYGPARAFIAICRSFHPVIVAILFVKAVGFGALAGVLALIVATMGFVAKLFAEVVEEMNPKQVEAVRATAAPFLNVLIMAVFPQVMARFVGLTVYQFDSNLRNSTMVGIVGGGGIGAPLFTAYQRFDYDVVLTILIIIVALIMLCELVSGRVRRIFQ